MPKVTIASLEQKLENLEEEHRIVLNNNACYIQEIEDLKRQLEDRESNISYLRRQLSTFEQMSEEFHTVFDGLGIPRAIPATESWKSEHILSLPARWIMHLTGSKP